MNKTTGPIRSHRDLDAWKHGMDLVDAIYDVTLLLPADERFGLVAQLRKAAVSVPANIAEGHGRDHLGDYLRHLSFSMGSVAELDTLVEICVRRRLLDVTQVAHLFPMIDRQGRILSGLIKALKRKY